MEAQRIAHWAKEGQKSNWEKVWRVRTNGERRAAGETKHTNRGAQENKPRTRLQRLGEYSGA